MVLFVYLFPFSPCFTAIPPRVTEEADRMMRKLRDLQSQVDERSSDVARKESQLHMLEVEKESSIKRLREMEGRKSAQGCTHWIYPDFSHWHRQ